MRSTSILNTLELAVLRSDFRFLSIYLPPGSPHAASIAAIVKNIIIYAASPLLLIDPVMASRWFDTPLPSEVLRGQVNVRWVLLTILPVCLIVLALFIQAKRVRDRLRILKWPSILF